MKVVIIDYKMGNIHSVVNKVRKNKIEPILCSSPHLIASADKIILPGVGHFGQAMKNLTDLNLVNAINEAVLVKKKPILGICLGMQLMTIRSEEGMQMGLGWVDSEVKRLKVNDKLVYKIPHIGWSSIKVEKQGSLIMKDIRDGSDFYFVHSYFCSCNNQQDVLNTSEYGGNFTSAIEKENIFGVQYHPEKSHNVGMQLFKNFLAL